MSEEFVISEHGKAVIESGLSSRQAHEFQTGCTARQLCLRCCRDMGPSWVAIGRERLSALEANPTTDGMAELAEWAVGALPGMLDTIEALCRDSWSGVTGWVVGQPTTEGWNFLRMYGGPDPMRAAAEQDLAGAIEEDGPGSGWTLLKVRQVTE